MPDLDEGGANGPATCFLVQASTPEEAAHLADTELARVPHRRVRPFADVVHLLVSSDSTEPAPRVVRGPYLENAFNRGWRVWHRGDETEAWVEWKP